MHFPIATLLMSKVCSKENLCRSAPTSMLSFKSTLTMDFSLLPLTNCPEWHLNHPLIIMISGFLCKGDLKWFILVKLMTEKPSFPIQYKNLPLLCSASIKRKMILRNSSMTTLQNQLLKACCMES